jgi:TP901 family phage tail tape measure protein
MMSTGVASLHVEIGLRDNLSDPLRRASSGLSGFSAQLGSVGGVGVQVFGALQSALAGAAGAFRSGISAAANFQTTMVEIKARTGATADEMKRISSVAMEMGAATVFSSQQAGDAMLQLMTSGQSAKEAMETLPAVLNLAAAGGIDLGKAADGVTDVMAAFGITGKEAAELVADSLARASGTSSATVDALLAGFANVGPIARSAGMGVEETAAVLALFSENGIKGAEAGTQLKSMLANLNTRTGRRELERLGVSMYDLRGRARPLNDVINDISKAMSTMTDQERTDALTALGGSYGKLGLAALTSGDSIQGMQEKMRAAASAAEVARARMDTFQGATDSLKGSIETLAIKALTPLMENVLTPLIKNITDVVNGIGKFVDDVQTIGFRAALEKWFKDAWDWLSTNGASIIKTAIENAFKALGDVVTLITTSAPSLLNAINTWFGSAFTFIEQHGGQLIKYAIEQAFAFLKNSVQAIAAIAPDIIEGVKTWFSNAWNAFKEVAPGIVETAFKEAFKLIKEFGGWLLKNAPDIVKGVIDWFKGAFDWIIKEGATFVFDVIRAVFDGIGEGLGLGKLGTEIMNAFTGLFGEGTPLRGLFDGFLGFVKGIFDAISAIIRAPIEAVQNLLGIKRDDSAEGASNRGPSYEQLARGYQTTISSGQVPIGQAPVMTRYSETDAGSRAILKTALPIDVRALEESAQKVDALKTKMSELVNTAAPNMTTFLQTTVPGLFTIAFGENSAATVTAQSLLGESGLLSSLLASAGKDMELFGSKAAGIGDAIGAGMQPVAGKMVSPVAEGAKRIANLLKALGAKSPFFSELAMLGAIMEAEANKLIEGRAAGGPVSANTPYLVGERGPELFMPSRGGTIVPNHALAGGTSIHIASITLNGVNDPKALYDAIEREARKRNRL